MYLVLVSDKTKDKNDYLIASEKHNQLINLVSKAVVFSALFNHSVFCIFSIQGEEMLEAILYTVLCQGCKNKNAKDEIFHEISMFFCLKKASSYVDDTLANMSKVDSTSDCQFLQHYLSIIIVLNICYAISRAN